jgi:hypothetical protein
VDDVPVAVSGAVTVALIVGLGIFVYPPLLKRPRGRSAVTIGTLLLAMLAFVFDRASGVSSNPLVASVAIAVAPLFVATIVHRLQRGDRS